MMGKTKGMQLLVQSHGVKKTTIELMFNGSSLGTWRFTYEGFKMTRIYSARWSVKKYVLNIRCNFMLQLDL